MSEYCIYLKMPSYLRHWFIHRHGGVEPVGIYTTVQDISLDGEAVCETETQFDNNSLLEKTTLTFFSNDNLPSGGQLAFVVTTVNKESYNIGKEQPYPTVKISRSTGTPSCDPSVRKYEVSFTVK